MNSKYTSILTLFIFFGFIGNVNGQVTSNDAWINEIHYDDPGADTNEFIEIVIKNSGDYDLSLFTVTKYNGSGGASYGSDNLDSFTVGDTEGDYIIYSLAYPSNGLQNGAPDGIALSYNGTLIQFLSYEGTFTASGGVADSVLSTDIGVSETNSGDPNTSLQLTGSGEGYSDFTWTGPVADSPGSLNTGQSFVASGATATKLAITTINDGSNPTSNTAFDVVIQSQDVDNNPANVDSETNVTLTLATGSGTLGGTLTGTISSGSNSVTISGVNYDVAESGVSLTVADDASGLTSGTSATFEVSAAADLLVINGFPSTGFADVSLESFTVEARRSGDNSVDESYSEDVTISKVSGSGILSGTVTKTAVNGVATFNDLSFDATGAYTVSAGDGTLTSATSSEVTLNPVSTTSDLFFSEYIEGSSNNKALEIYNASDSPVLFRGGGTNYYLILRLSNPSGTETWSDGSVVEFSDNSSVANGDVYVIGNAGAVAGISDEADETSSATFFNGNDPVALVRDVNNNGTYEAETDILLDVVGTLDGSFFGQDVTLVRKSDVQSGSETYDASEWNSESSDTFSFLGSHSYGQFLEITGSSGWRMLSFPVTGGTVADISDDTAIQGVAGGDNTSFNPNFLYFDSGTDSTSFVAPTNISTPFGDGKGFITYFYNNTEAGSSVLPITLDIAGEEPSSDVSVTLNTEGGFSLVGNPFASNLNLNALTVDAGTIQDNVTIWDNSTGSYQTLDRSTNEVASTWQGFWLEYTGANTLTIPTSAKTETAASASYFGKANSDDKRSDIKFELISETTTDKAIRLSLQENAILGWDAADASKFQPLLPAYATLGFVGEEKLKSVFSAPYNLDEDVTIPMQLDVVGVSGEFELSWSGMASLPNGFSVVLNDAEEGTSVNLSEVESYTFMVAAESAEKAKPLSVLNVKDRTTMKAKGNTERFSLTLMPSTTVSNEPNGTQPEVFKLDQNYPNPFNPTTNISFAVANAGNVEISVYNVMGQKVAAVLNENRAAGSYQVTFDASSLSSGIYYYRLKSAGQALTRQMTLIK